jgi:hypothetical protein
MISRTPGLSGYWHAVTRLGPDADLRFIGFFDFDQSLPRPSCFHVAVTSCPRHPELVYPVY